MGNKRSDQRVEPDNIFAGTADLFQRLGPDYRKNTDTIVSGALSLIGGSFSLYSQAVPPQVRWGANIPPGLAAAVETGKTVITDLPEKRKVIRPPLTDGLMEKYGVRSLIGAVVMADLKPFGILWVGDTCVREFNRDHSHAIECLAGALGCQAELRLADKNREVSEMARTVAHDLNNILSGLVSYPELMLMQVTGESPLHEPISFIHESGLLASDMIQDFLFLARPRSYTPSPIDPLPVVTAYVSGSAHALLKKNCPHVRFSFRADRPLGQLTISELFLTKLITTLVAHFAHGAAPGTRVDLCMRNQEQDKEDPLESGGLRLFVEDDAPALSRGDTDHLFDPFYTRKIMGRPGSGLGLAVVKKVVEDHGGKIRAGQKPDRGNFMEIVFPKS